MTENSNTYLPEKIKDDYPVVIIENKEFPAQGVHKKETNRLLIKATCNPTIPYSLNSTIEIDPEAFKSLGLGIFGNAKYSSIRFNRHNSSKITVDHEVFVSQTELGENIKLVAKQSGESYGAAITHSHSKDDLGCYKVNLVVNIPESFKSVDKFWFSVPHGHINPDFKGLQVDSIDIHVNVGSINLSGREANSIFLSTHVGSISLSSSSAQSITLLTNQGSISAYDVKSKYLYSRNSIGATFLNLIEAGVVYVKSYSGHSDVHIRSVANSTYSLQNIDTSHTFEEMFSEFLPKHHTKNQIESKQQISKKVESFSPKTPNQLHTGNSFTIDNYNGALLLSLPASFHTNFFAKSYVGAVIVSVPEKSDSFHFNVISPHVVSGYNFENNSNFVRATTYNGSPNIKFY